MSSVTPEYWFILQNDRLLMIKDAASLTFPSSALLDELKPHFLRQYYLGRFNQITCYCAEVDAALQLNDEILPTSLRKAFETLGVDWYAAGAKAISIINWDKKNQFCGHCGHATLYKQGAFERVCPQCGLSAYPRISPSIIVLIKNGDKILMSRSPHFPPGAYGLIAGFVEAGENIEEAVHREVKEEVGITIKNLCYYGSQSWPFPDSLMIGFFAEYESGEIMVDHTELESADWYRYDNLPGGPSTSVSIARKLIDHHIAQQIQGHHHGKL